MEFELDILSSSRFAAIYYKRVGGLKGEKKLMLAVLGDGLRYYQKYIHARDPRGQALFSDAKEWIYSADRIWFFSFENLCETLETNPDHIRRLLRQWEVQVSNMEIKTSRSGQLLITEKKDTG